MSFTSRSTYWPFLGRRGDLAESTQMGYYMSIGVNVTFSNSSLYYITVLPSQGETTHKVQQMSVGKLGQIQWGHESFSTGTRRNCGSGEKNLKQPSTLLRHEIFCRFPWASGYVGLGNSKRRSRGDEGSPGCLDEDQGGSNEPLAAAAAAEETEAEDTRVLLSPNLSSGDKRIFIFGFGYTSCALARYLQNSWKVSGTCRSEEKRAALEQWGYSVHVFNSDNDGEELNGKGLRELQKASHWLISVPPVADFDNDPVLNTHVQDLSQAVRKGNVGWIGYLSSTGVYGDWQGDWVDEESKPRPVEQRSLARLAAEESWLSFGLNHGIPVHIFRLGGIYGPGRSAVETVLRNQTLSARQRNREQRRFISRIHVADVCQAVLASMENSGTGKIYNVVDDDPASRMEVLSYTLDLLHKQEINSCHHLTEEISPSTNMALGGSNLSNPKGEKRVSNKRIKLDLKVELLYPTYRQGLKAIFETMKENSKVA